ncbi:MAG: DegT/DnrJ/EryC1/StrS aminotransferase family protein [Vicingaceae bacterium]
MIPFSPPKIYQEIIDEVVDTLKSGWITTGPKTKKLEQNLVEYTGAQKVICLNSATIGMELILRWFGVKEGDEVILPAYTYCATANVVLHCGAKPVMVDVKADFNIDLDEVKSKITSRTKAIIPVDIGGYPCDYDQLNALIRSEEVKSLFKAENEEQKQLGRILLMADAAHSLGAKYKGKKLGREADATVFSFHAVKNLTTAEGGAVALNFPGPFDNEEIYKRLNMKSLHGQSKDALAKTVGNWRYDVSEAGYKANMTDILASLGLVELQRYDSETIPRRKEIVNQYFEAFKSEKWAELPCFKTEEKESSYHLFMLRINGISESQRDAIIDEIFKQEVSVNVHFQPLPLLSLYKGLGYQMKDYPVAFNNYHREISLPVYYDLSDENVKTVVDAVKNAVHKVLG